jgi:hypothetical protein
MMSYPRGRRLGVIVRLEVFERIVAIEDQSTSQSR